MSTKAVIILELDMTDDSPLLANVALAAATAAHEAAENEMGLQLRLGIDSTAVQVLAHFDDLNVSEKRSSMSEPL